MCEPFCLHRSVGQVWQSNLQSAGDRFVAQYAPPKKLNLCHCEGRCFPGLKQSPNSHGIASLAEVRSLAMTVSFR
jgi:hypothetical protein